VTTWKIIEIMKQIDVASVPNSIVHTLPAYDSINRQHLGSHATKNKYGVSA